MSFPIPGKTEIPAAETRIEIATFCGRDQEDWEEWSCIQRSREITLITLIANPGQFVITMPILP